MNLSHSNINIASRQCASAAADAAASGTELELEAERIARELKLPPCPLLLTQLHRVMNDDGADQGELVAMVSADLAMSAAVLKTVNSPLYGLYRPTSSIQQALSIISLRMTANLISRLLFRQAFPSAAGKAMQQFWDDSARLTEIAGEIARRVVGVNVDEAMTYMVFRDCGFAVMINRNSDYGNIWQAHRNGHAYESLRMEQHEYRTNHAYVGSTLAREWRLPESLWLAILCHHEIARPSREPLQVRGAPVKLAAFGLLVDQIVSIRNGLGVTADWEIAEAFVLGQLALTPDQVINLFELA